MYRPAGVGRTIHREPLGLSTKSADIVQPMGHRLKSSWAVSALRATRAFVFALALGLPCATSQALPPDYGRGLNWHQVAAESGMVEAQFRLGLIYETGVKTAPDPAAARHWYRRAAEQGHMPSD